MDLRKSEVRRLTTPFTTKCRDQWPPDLQSIVEPYMKYSSQLCRVLCMGKRVIELCRCSTLQQDGIVKNRLCNLTEGTMCPTKCNNLCLSSVYISTDSPDLGCYYNKVLSEDFDCHQCRPACYEVSKSTINGLL